MNPDSKIAYLDIEQKKGKGSIVSTVDKDSSELYDFITWNRKHSEIADKKAMVYVEQWDNLPVHPYKDLHETAISLKSMIGTKVQREVEGKILDYIAIDGDKIKQFLPDIWKLIPDFQPLAEQLWGGPLVPLNDQAAININIVPPLAGNKDFIAIEMR